MAVFVVCLVLFLAMAGHSSAAYCVCKDGVGDSVLQKNIDYACGAGADCSQITQNGPCYNPNTVKDHCNYAVNSYYQKKTQATGSCDFQGTATVTQTAPTTSSGCVFPSSPSTGGTTPTPTPTGGTPGGTTNPTTGTPSSTIPGSANTPSVFGLGPSGNAGINPDNSIASLNLPQITTLTLLFSGLLFLRV